MDVATRVQYDESKLNTGKTVLRDADHCLSDIKPIQPHLPRQARDICHMRYKAGKPNCKYIYITRDGALLFSFASSQHVGDDPAVPRHGAKNAFF